MRQIKARILLLSLSVILSLFFSSEIFAQNNKNISDDSQTQSSDKITVTGKEVDERNQPLPGATILILGSSRVITSESDGPFTLALSNRTTHYLY